MKLIVCLALMLMVAFANAGEYGLKMRLPECEPNNTGLYYGYEGNNVRYVIEGSFKHPYHTVFEKPRLHNVIALAYSRLKQSLVFVEDTLPARIYIYNNQTKAVIFIDQDVENFDELAVDGLTGNVYYISYESVIGLCDPDFAACVRLIEPSAGETNNLRNLVLHPKSAQMFWLEGKGGGKVMTAHMNGKKVRHHASSKTIFSITLDSAHDMLYLTTGQEVLQWNLLTKEEKVLSKIESSFLYYYDCKLFYIESYNNFQNIYHPPATSQQIGRLTSYKVMLSSESDEGLTSVDNPCRTSGCDSICVLAKSGFKITYDCSFDRARKRFLIPVAIGLAIALFFILALFIAKCGLCSRIRGVCCKKTYKTRETTVSYHKTVVPVHA